VTGAQGDVALDGDGVLVLRGAVDGSIGDYYSRAGQLRLDSSGCVVNPDGLVVQGWAVSPSDSESASASALRVSNAALPPRRTSHCALAIKLDSDAVTPARSWDPQAPIQTSNLQTSIEVFDSLGQRQYVDVYFRRESPGAWSWHAVVSAASTEVGDPDGWREVGSGSLGFNEAGELASSGVTAPITIDFNANPPGQGIELDFGALGGTSQPALGSSQYSGASRVIGQNQDGYPPGSFADFEIDGEGLVSAKYSNGESLAVGRLAIARFRSNEGLARAGRGLWTATRESGGPALGAAASGGRGSIAHGATEASNVCVTSELVELIAYQTAFNASSRVFATANAMGDALRDVGRQK
jgi:flagellar hook protein FlgE